MDYTDYLKIALQAVQAAKEILYRSFRLPLEVKTKSTHYDLVTQADIACETEIVRVIRETFPDHNILAEENDYGKTDSPFTWVIDPLDGTNNFAHRFPHYSISIALALDDKVVVGLVCDPERNELFQAVQGKGALLNSVSIKVTETASLQQSLLVTGFYYERGEKMRESLSKVGEFLSLGITDIRRLGSAALDLCYIACGRTDGYFEFMLNPWDFAAGKLVLEEAGGKATDREGKPLGIAPSYIVASNAKIHEAMLNVLQN